MCEIFFYLMVKLLLNTGNREFRVVRDNRVSQNTNKDMKPSPVQSSAPNKEKVIANVSEKG